MKRVMKKMGIIQEKKTIPTIHECVYYLTQNSSSEDETEEKSSLADRDWDHPPSNFFQTEYS